MSELSKHDMLPRLADEEPGFLLAARDPRAHWFVWLYAAARARDLSRMDAVYNNLRRECMALPYNPEKDAEHALAARERGTAMLAWLDEHKIKPPGMREEFTPGPDVYRDGDTRS